MDLIIEIARFFIDFILHIDVHLGEIIENYGLWTYLILFTIVFCETGFVVTPFLPGDSMLFAVGAFSALGSLDLFTAMVLLMAAAIIGDTINYWIGKKVGPRVFYKENVRFLNKKHLDRTHAFYLKHGGKTIIIARFMPFIRTFAPFVAGIGVMSYPRFLAFNVIGGVAWVALFTLGGYFFGNLPVVKENFTLVIMAIIVISVMPMVIEAIRAHREKKRAAADGTAAARDSSSGRAVS
jgi:membrane-associated protein